MLIRTRNAPVSRRTVVATSVALGLVAGALAPLGRTALRAAPPMQRQSPCTCVVDKVSTPGEMRLCDTATVTVTLSATCPGAPVHIVLIIDEVYKIGYSNPSDRTNALRNSVNRLELDKNPQIVIAVVWMQNGSARKRLDFTNEAREVISNLDVPPVSRFDAPPQCFDCGFREAVRLLDDREQELPDNTDIHEIVVLAPLGVYNTVSNAGVRQGSNMAKSRGADVISTCFAWTHCDPVLRQAASEARLYLAYGEGNRLAALLHDVVRESVTAFLRTVHVLDKVPEGINVVEGSIVPAPGAQDPAAGTIEWQWEQPFQKAYTLTYQVQASSVGGWQLGQGALVTVEDSLYRTFQVPLPVAPLTVSMECPAEPTPTPTFTPEPTSTTVPSATPVPTRALKPLYLPIAVREKCKDLRRYADVALVVDVSTSMRQPASDGRTKMEAAVAAARLFVGAIGLNGNPDADRVAVVGFNRTGWIQQPLTADRGLVDAALEGLVTRMQEHTRLDLALSYGGAALEGSGPGRERILVLLTDGLPNQVPYAEDGTMDTTILRQARAVKDAGATVYTIGLGRADGPQPEVNAWLLARVASRPDTAYLAPDALDLGRIYQQIAVVIPCGAGPYWPNK